MKKISGTGFLILGMIFGYFGMQFVVTNKDEENKVLSLETAVGISPTQIPTPALTPSSTPTPTLTPTPTPLPPTPSPTPTPIPQPVMSQEVIHHYIESYAGQYAVDPNVLRHLATCESGFNQFAVNGVYAGMFQFSPNTWKKFRLQIGEDPGPDLRFNAEESVQTAAYTLSQGRIDVWPNCRP